MPRCSQCLGGGRNGCLLGRRVGAWKRASVQAYSHRAKVVGLHHPPAGRVGLVLHERRLLVRVFRENALYESLELGQVAVRGIPDNLQAHTEVLMDQDVPHPLDSAPGDVRVLLDE